MASTDGQNEVLIDVQNEINRFRASVTDLSISVGRLTTDVAGLMALRDGSVYGESYADDDGPAVRAKFFEVCARSNGKHGHTITDLEGNLATLTGITTNYSDSVDRMPASVIKLEDELSDLRNRVCVCVCVR